MGNYITFGEYNNLYKYIWVCILLQLIFEYFFGTDFTEEMKYFKKYSFPKSVLIQEGFDYLGIFILSIFLLLYENSQNKNENRLSESLEINHTNSHKGKHKNPSLIFIDYENQSSHFTSIFAVIILTIICDQLMNTFFIFNLKGLNYRMCELFFVSFITLKMFKIPIYRHKKLAIAFILILCCLMKNLSTYFRLIDDHKKRIFKIYGWIIPVGISSFILLSLLRAYTFCNIKGLLELKFISISKFFIVYGFFGSLICFIISIIPTIIPCTNSNNINSFKNIEFICNVTDIDYTHNSTIYYYDNYLVYFKSLWQNDRKLYNNILFLFLNLFKIILSFLIKLYCVLIIKNLSPEYLICSNSIFYFISEVIDTIVCLFLNKFKYYKLYDILDELCSILGTIFYLELIEFNFCGLDFDLRRSIVIRSIREMKQTKTSGSIEVEEDM